MTTFVLLKTAKGDFFLTDEKARDELLFKAVARSIYPIRVVDGVNKTVKADYKSQIMRSQD